MSAPKSMWKAADYTLGSILVLIPTLKTSLAQFPNDSLCPQIPLKKTTTGKEGPTKKMSWFWVLQVAHKVYERSAAITPMPPLTLIRWWV